MTDKSETFLHKYSDQIKQRTRTPLALADTLHAHMHISKEMLNRVQAEKHKIDQMREIYSNLNNQAVYECTFAWLMENESNLIKELRK